MIICGNKLYFIIDKSDPSVQMFLEYDPEHVELKNWDTMHEVHQVTTGWWYCSLDTVEMLYGEAQWICPD